MPHTVRDVLTLALKKIGVLRAGGQPTAADAEDARASLESWYAECITQGAFGRVRDINVSRTGSITSSGNQHINVTTDGAVSVEIPATLPSDHWNTWMPCRDYGWGLNVPLGADTGANVPRDKSVVMVTDQFGPGRLTYIYDGTIQRWMRTDTIALTDEAPLSARGFDGLASLLAVRLLDLFGDTLASAMTIRAANSYKLALVSNYGNEEDCVYG